MSSRLITGIAAFAITCGCAPEESESIPPNIILISLDTLRYDHCSVNGYARETTPFLEELA